MLGSFTGSQRKSIPSGWSAFPLGINWYVRLLGGVRLKLFPVTRSEVEQAASATTAPATRVVRRIASSIGVCTPLVHAPRRTLRWRKPSQAKGLPQVAPPPSSSKADMKADKARTVPDKTEGGHRRGHGLTRPDRALSALRDGAFLRSICGPVVIELEIRLRLESDVEAERKISVRRPREVEDRAPVVHVALQPDVLVGELVQLEVVARRPLQRPLQIGRAH